MFRVLGYIALCLMLSMTLGIAQGYAAPDNSFYQGKTLTIIVPYGAGGGHDKAARLIGPYFEKSLGLSGVKVVNEPGAGGIIGSNDLYKRDPDGITIGIINAGNIFSQMKNQSGVKFDMKNYTILGGMNYAPLVFCAHPDGKYRSFADLLKADQPVQVLVDGVGSAAYQVTNIVMNAFDIPHKMIGGFKGMSAALTTFLTGNADLVVPGLHHLAALGDRIEPVMILGDRQYAGLPNVPTLAQKVENANFKGKKEKALSTLAKSLSTPVIIAAPPSVPKDRAESLRAALKQTVENPAFRKQAEKANQIPRYTPAESVESTIKNIFSNSSEFDALSVSN